MIEKLHFVSGKTLLQDRILWPLFTRDGRRSHQSYFSSGERTG